jgi:hypothetical protein
MQELEAVNNRVAAETLSQQKTGPAQVQADLRELARRCEIKPRSFDE